MCVNHRECAVITENVQVITVNVKIIIENVQVFIEIGDNRRECAGFIEMFGLSHCVSYRR